MRTRIASKNSSKEVYRHCSSGSEYQSNQAREGNWFYQRNSRNLSGNISRRGSSTSDYSCSSISIKLFDLPNKYTSREQLREEIIVIKTLLCPSNYGNDDLRCHQNEHRDYSSKRNFTIDYLFRSIRTHR